MLQNIENRDSVKVIFVISYDKKMQLFLFLLFVNLSFAVDQIIIPEFETHGQKGDSLVSNITACVKKAAPFIDVKYTPTLGGNTNIISSYSLLVQDIDLDELLKYLSYLTGWVINRKELVIEIYPRNIPDEYLIIMADNYKYGKYLVIVPHYKNDLINKNKLLNQKVTLKQKFLLKQKKLEIISYIFNESSNYNAILERILSTHSVKLYFSTNDLIYFSPKISTNKDHRDLIKWISGRVREPYSNMCVMSSETLSNKLTSFYERFGLNCKFTVYKDLDVMLVKSQEYDIKMLMQSPEFIYVTKSMDKSGCFRVKKIKGWAHRAQPFPKAPIKTGKKGKANQGQALTSDIDDN